MANPVVKGHMVLSNGQTIRIVEQTPAGPPYFLEILNGMDALGVPIWQPAPSLSAQSVIDILVATTVLP